MATNGKEVVAATNNGVAQYVPFGGQRIELGDEAIAPAPEYALLQYATGLPARVMKQNPDGSPVTDEETGEVTYDNIFYAGFFTEYGKIKDLDDAMKQVGASTIEIVHGNGETKKHWMLQKPVLFLVAKGIPSNAQSNGEQGIAYTWRTKRDSTRSESVIYVQVMLRKIVPYYWKPFIFTVKSTQTVDLLNAMKTQFKVLRRVHEELQRVNADMPLPLWSYSITLAPAKKPVMRGAGEQQKQIFPLVAMVPDEIDLAYLQRHEMPIEYADTLKESGDKSVEWATALTQRIIQGVETHEPWQAAPPTTPAAQPSDTPF